MDQYAHTMQTWNKLADQYQEIFMEDARYDHTYDAFCNSINKENARLLEIGCGPGNITRYLLKKKPGASILATDNAAAMVERAAENNPAATCRVLDAREIATLCEKFDGIICGFCMPYLTIADGSRFIQDAGNMLLSGGTFYCSVIESEHTLSRFETSSDGQHTMLIHYYSEKDIREYIKAGNMEISNTFRIRYPKNDGSISVHLIIIANKPMDQ